MRRAHGGIANATGVALVCVAVRCALPCASSVAGHPGADRSRPGARHQDTSGTSRPGPEGVAGRVSLATSWRLNSETAAS